MENWKDIEGYEGLYQISDLGNVRSLDRLILSEGNSRPTFKKGILLKPHLNRVGRRFGYYQIYLCKRKRFYVHRLVAAAFIPNPLNLGLINHKDGNGTNNLPSNLEWCTYSQNKLHSARILDCKVAHRKMVLDTTTGIFFDSKLAAFKSKPQTFKFSQFYAMIAGRWSNKTPYILV